MYTNLYLLEQLTRAAQMDLLQQAAATSLLARLRMALPRPTPPVAPAPPAPAAC